MTSEQTKAGFGRIIEVLESAHTRDEDVIHPHIEAKLEELRQWAEQYSAYAASEKARIDDLSDRVTAIEEGIASIGAPTASSTVSSGALDLYSGSATFVDPSQVVGGGTSALTGGGAATLSSGASPTSAGALSAAGTASAPVDGAASAGVVDPASGALVASGGTAIEPSAAVESAATAPAEASAPAAISD